MVAVITFFLFLGAMAGVALGLFYGLKTIKLI
jgi:hypothetical protein